MQGGSTSVVRSPIILQSTMRLQERLRPRPTRKGTIEIILRKITKDGTGGRRVRMRVRAETCTDGWLMSSPRWAARWAARGPGGSPRWVLTTRCQTPCNLTNPTPSHQLQSHQNTYTYTVLSVIRRREGGSSKLFSGTNINGLQCRCINFARCSGWFAIMHYQVDISSLCSSTHITFDRMAANLRIAPALQPFLVLNSWTH